MPTITVTLETAGDTAALGARLAPRLSRGDIVRLEGPLGAGKTTLARGLIAAFCGEPNAPSPTFGLAAMYEGPAFPLWHFDFYRLKTPAEIWELGVEEAFEEGASLIEWPERAGDLLPDAALTISLAPTGNGRRAVLEASDDAWAERLRELTPGAQNRDTAPQ